MARVFILESPNPIDLLENRGERSSLESVCNLFGYDTAAFLLTGRSDLKRALMYIREVGECSNLADGDEPPLFIHISAHGNNEGISIGSDFVKWRDLAAFVVKMYSKLRRYTGLVILVLSSCGSKGQKMTRLWAKISRRFWEETGEDFFPPEYVFVFSDDEIDWRDSLAIWTIFYRKASELDFSRPIQIQALLRLVAKLKFGNLTYHRLDRDEKQYKRFSARTSLTS